MNDKIPGERPRLDFRQRIVSPAVREAISARAGKEGKAALVPVIITPTESTEHPEAGAQPSKEAILTILKDYAPRSSQYYVFAKLPAAKIEELTNQHADLVEHVWVDEKCSAHLLESTRTVKASAAWKSFDAFGEGITWAVMDTGIEATHPHFAMSPIAPVPLSQDFSDAENTQAGDPLKDPNGHGTHVAGIIAGGMPPSAAEFPLALLQSETGPSLVQLKGYPSGIAPKCRLLSLRVLDENGDGDASAAILALEHLRKLNAASKGITVDGVNMSLGYPFDPQWYGCGHSPLCEEVDRTVQSGIVVVISCGNSGYGQATLSTQQTTQVFIGLSIADPANAKEGIAVGSVHKSSPHTYGVSYFSSKGPTGDGRVKPDLVAPGEKIISCAIDPEGKYLYKDDSGTSMAAPHVSGAIAAFLSVHKEFRGDPARIKHIFKQSANDLGRDKFFQGAGLIDLYRALSSV